MAKRPATTEQAEQADQDKTDQQAGAQTQIQDGAADKDPDAQTDQDKTDPQAGAQAPEREDGTDEEPGSQYLTSPVLVGLDQLAMLYRVPSWQQAALARMQGWETGKHVTAEEYEAALAALTARPQGGR